MELYMDRDASDVLDSVEADPTRAGLAQQVDAVIDRLLADPGDSSLRRRRFTNGLWCVVVPDPVEPWVILWEMHPEDPEGVVVHYLGPASFT